VKTSTLKYALVAFGSIVLCAGAAQAAPLDFSGTAAQAAAQTLGDKYGVHIVFKGDFSPDLAVTFSLADADADGARLQAVNALANAVGADFQKTFVISKADAGSTNVPADLIDTNAVVAFRSRTVTADDAVRRITGADNAGAQFYGDIGQTVTFSATTLSAREAAREVAAQTHTRWKAFYALLPRAQGHALGGKVIDRTASGSPIVEEPYVYYQPQTVHSLPTQAAQKGNGTQTGSQNQVAQQTPNNGQSPNGMMLPGDGSNPYYYPYGFNPYAGNNPYSQNLYAGGGFGSPFGSGSLGGGGNIGGGVVVDNGYQPPIVFGGGGF